MAEDLKYYYFTFDTSAGCMGLLASDRGLAGATLPRLSAREARQLLGDRAREAGWSPDRFGPLAERLKAFFDGRRVDFPDTLDLSGATGFQLKVWEITRRIPYGETRSYRWVAGQMDRPQAARAVGQALARNPLPIIIPCHRVLSSNGQITGYSGGVAVKERLLRLEAPVLQP